MFTAMVKFKQLWRVSVWLVDKHRIITCLSTRNVVLIKYCVVIYLWRSSIARIVQHSVCYSMCCSLSDSLQMVHMQRVPHKTVDVIAATKFIFTDTVIYTVFMYITDNLCLACRRYKQW